MTLDHDNRLDDLLRTLDPATDEFDTAARGRADALLERIVATPSAGRRRRLRVRWVAIGAAAAAFTVAATTLPSLWPAIPAYGTWTADPIPVTGTTRDKAVAACQQSMADFGKDWTGPHRPVPMAETARTVIAEQRGQVILVSLITDNDSSLTCTFDAHRPGRLASAGGGSATADTPLAAPLSPEQLRSFGGAGLRGGRDDGFADAAGRVGSDVRSVTIHANGVTLEASVNDGIFAAWWPVRGPFEEPMIMDLRFDVTLADGRTLTDVPDGMDRGPRPGPREIGRVQRGGGIGSDGDIGTAGGLVGSEVIGVTVHTDGRDTPAEVANGTFRARWTLPKGSAENQATAGPGPATYTLTLRDGSVLQNVRPVSGSGS